MPWIDAGALKEKYADQLSVQRVFGYDAVFVAGILAALEMPTLSPPNEPLTLDELREMDGEPVYIVFFPDTDGEKLQFWALVAVDEWGEIYLMNNLGGAAAYEEVWANIEAIYPRPPEGEL